MDYVLAIKSPVYGAQGAFLAYQVAKELLKTNHTIRQIFFFQEGISNANVFINPANDEINLMEQWQILAKSHNLSLHLCIAAAQRRGVIDKTSSHLNITNLAEHFTLAGLGEFSQAVLQADRLLTF